MLLISSCSDLKSCFNISLKICNWNMAATGCYIRCLYNLCSVCGHLFSYFRNILSNQKRRAKISLGLFFTAVQPLTTGRILLAYNCQHNYFFMGKIFSGVCNIKSRFPRNVMSISKVQLII